MLRNGDENVKNGEEWKNTGKRRGGLGLTAIPCKSRGQGQDKSS